LAAELLQEFENQVAEIILIPSDGGRFEVTLDETLVFSKKKSLRHADPGEIVHLVRTALLK
jgi:selenoprotein W-related protein